MQNSLYHTQCFCFFLFSVLCSTAFSPQDVLCCPFPNQKFSCTKYKKRCHDIFHGQNSLTSVNFSFSKPIAKKHPCSKDSIGHPIQPIHGHSHYSSNRRTCREENFSKGLLHCGYPLKQKIKCVKRRPVQFGQNEAEDNADVVDVGHRLRRGGNQRNPNKIHLLRTAVQIGQISSSLSEIK